MNYIAFEDSTELMNEMVIIELRGYYGVGPSHLGCTLPLSSPLES